MWPNPQKTADLVAFTEEILNGKLKFSGKETNHGLTELWNTQSHHQLSFPADISNPQETSTAFETLNYDSTNINQYYAENQIHQMRKQLYQRIGETLRNWNTTANVKIKSSFVVKGASIHYRKCDKILGKKI